LRIRRGHRATSSGSRHSIDVVDGPGSRYGHFGQSVEAIFSRRPFAPVSSELYGVDAPGQPTRAQTDARVVIRQVGTEGG